MNNNTVTEKRLGGDIIRLPYSDLPSVVQLAQQAGTDPLGIPPEYLFRNGQVVEMVTGEKQMILADVPNPYFCSPLAKGERPDPNTMTDSELRPNLDDGYQATTGRRVMNTDRWNELFGLQQRLFISNSELMWLATDSMHDIETGQHRNRVIDPAVLSQHLKQDDEAEHEVLWRHSHDFVNLSYTDRHIRIKIKLDVLDGSPYRDEITLDVMPPIADAVKSIEQYDIETGDKFTMPYCDSLMPAGVGTEIYQNWVLDNANYEESLEGMVA